MLNSIQTEKPIDIHSQIRKLVIGQKYTIVSFSSTGNPYQLQMIFKGMRCDAYGPHSEAYFLSYKRPKKNVLYNIWLHEGKQFLIWEDHVNPDTRLECGSFKKDGNGYVAEVFKRWPNWDARYMHRAKESVLYPPIVESIKPVTGPERVHNFLTAS